ncbi:hypothetical protein [Haloarcula sp. R1-2]|uniref:hypothetical protein n=1 Tax=Haloarcula sp. R1-2 TaxID=2715750 RepID=UPI000F8F241B|nr:hypothetical protein [Haloarcula sp. R1-2]NHX39807.1 hypothetical protein [Haloarcula sp. R1-2]
MPNGFGHGSTGYNLSGAVETTYKQADGRERVVRQLSHPKRPGEGQACGRAGRLAYRSPGDRFHRTRTE